MSALAEQSDKPALGFIGLGVMGLPMAQHLAMAGYTLTVYDINPQRTALVRAAFPDAQVALSPMGVAAASDIIITMLPSGREVRDTVFSPDGLLQGVRPGSLLLDTSSSEPWLTKEVASSLASASVGMVDAPVSGAETGAVTADLVFMAGGSAEGLRRVMPVLSILGKKVFHLGPVGSGHMMKSVNNLITAVVFTATAEGLLIGANCGLDPAVMNEVLNESTGMSWISRNHIAQRILNGRFDDPFKFDLMVKDIGIALQLACDAGLMLQISTDTQVLWRDIQSSIPKGSSVSELVRALEARSGVTLRPSPRDGEPK